MQFVLYSRRQNIRTAAEKAKFDVYTQSSSMAKSSKDSAALNLSSLQTMRQYAFGHVAALAPPRAIHEEAASYALALLQKVMHDDVVWRLRCHVLSKASRTCRDVICRIPRRIHNLSPSHMSSLGRHAQSVSLTHAHTNARVHTQGKEQEILDDGTMVQDTKQEIEEDWSDEEQGKGRRDRGPSAGRMIETVEHPRGVKRMPAPLRLKLTAFTSSLRGVKGVGNEEQDEVLDDDDEEEDEKKEKEKEKDGELLRFIRNCPSSRRQAGWLSAVPSDGVGRNYAAMSSLRCDRHAFNCVESDAKSDGGTSREDASCLGFGERRHKEQAMSAAAKICGKRGTCRSNEDEEREKGPLVSRADAKYGTSCQDEEGQTHWLGSNVYRERRKFTKVEQRKSLGGQSGGNALLSAEHAVFTEDESASPKKFFRKVRKLVRETNTEVETQPPRPNLIIPEPILCSDEGWSSCDEDLQMEMDQQEDAMEDMAAEAEYLPTLASDRFKKTPMIPLHVCAECYTACLCAQARSHINVHPSIPNYMHRLDSCRLSYTSACAIQNGHVRIALGFDLLTICRLASHWRCMLGIPATLPRRAEDPRYHCKH